ncbi:MAG TPA: hypothetical protein VN112_03705 [Ensifer sp.]|nr:hypothetical protein [Ensifer sp.]
MQSLKRHLKNVFFAPQLDRLIKANPAGTHTAASISAAAFDFVMSCKSPAGDGFCFTSRSKTVDIYSTSYAIALLGLIGRLDSLSLSERKAIADRIHALQCDDGLYRDPNLVSPVAETGQGWGWMHLLPHVLIALDYLEDVPHKPLLYALRAFDQLSPEDWYSQKVEKDQLTASNEFMNVVTALQYSRDFAGASEAAPTISSLLDVAERLVHQYAEGARNDNVFLRSKHVKSIYHLIPNMIYDRTVSPAMAANIRSAAEATQTKRGSFGTTVIADACEDIDSIYLISLLIDSDRSATKTLNAATAYLPVNSNSDGGFVFRRFFPFCYGQCPALSSDKDESNLFATWFRVLAYAFADNAIQIAEHGAPSKAWRFSRMPGYQFWPQVSIA